MIEGVLTIGEAARLAGVTVRAVRHYHQRGLLAEPERDASGYRRYTADDVVTLLRIRTLGEAGVPLARVAELLRADDDEFAAALTEVDAQLRAEIRRLQKHRAAVAALPRGAELALPAEVVAYLDRLRGIGLREDAVRMEGDAWMIIAAQIPDRIPVWIAQKNRDLDVPEFRELYLRLQEASDWDVDDPRLEPLADRLVEIFETMTEAWDAVDPTSDGLSRRLVQLLDAQAVSLLPPLARLVVLLEERGYTGWTDMSRADDSQSAP
jgi:DNA-binding transcriptional MerR regulator